MKKIVKTVLMLTCVFGLTACGVEEMDGLQEIRENTAIEKAEQIAAFTAELIEMDSINNMLDNYDEIADSMIQELQASDTVEELLSNYGNVELGEVYALAYSQYSGDYSFACEGKAVRGALTSFQSGYESMGSIWTDTPDEAVVDGDTIVVTVPVTGDEDASGSVEVIFTNDIHLKMTSCTLNLDETKGQLMTRAALNTLLGMGTVFVVLILISLIISAFGVIPKIQASFASQKKAPELAPKAVPAPVVVEEEEDLSDDMELVAVIAAAIAAYEGTSVEGFRVRSIKRADTIKWKKG